MKLTINIQDIKAAVFIEFLKSLDYVKIEDDNLELDAEVKAMLDKRIKPPLEACSSRDALNKNIKNKYAF